MTTARTMIRSGLFMPMLLATTLGWAIAGVLIINLGWGLAETLARSLGDVLGTALAFGISGALAGVVIGLAQGLALQRYIARWGLWVLATAAGLGIGFGLGISVAVSAWGSSGDPGALSLVIISLGIALPIGVAQWFVLRQRVAHSAGWVLVNIVAVTVFFALVNVLGGEGREWIALSVSSVAIGAITALGATRVFERTA